jgi:hypothetical protein
MVALFSLILGMAGLLGVFFGRQGKKSRDTPTQLSMQEPKVQTTPSISQETSSVFEIVGEESPRVSAHKHSRASSSAADQRPNEYNSLPTGTRIVPDDGTDGHGQLTVQNGTLLDAVVRLYDANTYQTRRCFFVKSGTTAEMIEIPEAIYFLAYTTGLNWIEAEDGFTWHPAYDRFDRVLRYQEHRDTSGLQYHDIRVTLQPVEGGNARTQRISRGEFLKGHKQMPLLQPAPLEEKRSNE